MALSGDKNPDVSVMKTGSSRQEIETSVGPPVSESENADGTKSATYEYEVGNEASGGRAAMHGLMDVLTLGIWEVVGTPTEAMMGQKYKLIVRYDEQDKAQELKIEKLP